MEVHQGDELGAWSLDERRLVSVFSAIAVHFTANSSAEMTNCFFKTSTEYMQCAQEQGAIVLKHSNQ